MENLNKTQKIVLYGIGIILAILIIIYLFTKDNTVYSDFSNLYEENNQVVVENTVQEEEIPKNLIYVYVAGEVNNPSVVELEEGQRVADAIEKAGGLTESGEIKNINLAYKLKDGEKLYIPSLDEVIESEEEDTNIAYITSGINGEINGTTSNSENNSENSTSNGLININTATQTELETLDGIGPSTAKKIIDYREENGKFNSIEDIQNVSGIGDAKYAAIKDDICV